ncbi:MAG: DNA polymerase I, partial [Thermoguttaceae bacterium]|nr:DNA polymerase I [Thermoguttaceae bacterium]
MPSLSLFGKTVCVIDAYGLLYQVFHAPGMEMTNARGEPTGAAFGFVRDVLSIMTKLRPDYLFCAYDMHAKTFRSAIYSEYKANRPPTPDDLLLQFDFTREFLKGVGVPALGVVGFEADDILATVSKQTEELGGSTVLVTSDKDARQLLSKSTSIYLLRKEKYYREPELLADWGITPDQVVDFQSLVGDSTDNVPGVPLIGPKVASELLARHKTLEGVIAGAQDQKGKRFENLRNFADDAYMSRDLVRLRTDVPVELDWNAGKLGGVDPDRLRALFQYWNFRSFAGKVDALAETFGTARAEQSAWFDKIAQERREFLGGAPTIRVTQEPLPLFAAAERESDADVATEFDADAPLIARFGVSQYGSSVKTPTPKEESFDDFELVGVRRFPSLASLTLPDASTPRERWTRSVVDDAEKLAALAARLKTAQTLSIATITLELADVGRVRPRFATLCGLALAIAPEEAFYLPFRASFGEAALDRSLALDALRPILESDAVAKLGFELKYDALVLLDAGIKLRGLAFDASLADYLVRSGETRRDLLDLAQTYLDSDVFNLKEALGAGKKKIPLDALPTTTLARYAADCVLVPLNAAPTLRAKLQETAALERLAVDLETPLVEPLAEMEFNGIAIEPERFKEASAAFLQKQETLEREIRALIGDVDPDPNFANEINLNSPKQLQRLLFDDLRLPVSRKTKTGPSVDAEVLEELAELHPSPEKIVELRKTIKLRGTYLDPLPTQTLPTTNRICATFNQAATATGRLSSSDPNLQNIPARSSDGKFIRAGFVPDKSLGFDAFVSCDYSQIELRVLAHYTGDAELKRAFAENRDIHAAVASRIFNVAPEDVTSDMRRKAKAVNFGLVYGQTSFGLSKSLGISASDAASYIDAFFATYPSVLTFFDRVLDDCARKGYVQTALGRRRALSGVRGARGRKTLNFPERAAINAVV